LESAPVHRGCITVTTAGAVLRRRRMAFNASGSTFIRDNQVRVDVDGSSTPSRAPRDQRAPVPVPLEVPDGDSSVSEAMRGAVQQVHAPPEVAHRRAEPVGSYVGEQAAAKGQRRGGDLHEPARHGTNLAFREPRRPFRLTALMRKRLPAASTSSRSSDMSSPILIAVCSKSTNGGRYLSESLSARARTRRQMGGRARALALLEASRFGFEPDSGRPRRSRGSAGARLPALGRCSPRVPSLSIARPGRGCRANSAEWGRPVRAAIGRGSRDRCHRYDVIGPRGRYAIPVIRVRSRRVRVFGFGREFRQLRLRIEAEGKPSAD
jgi:hypothetical protein